MIFCKECNNILYPKEDKEQRKLLYACRNCDHSEDARHSCVFRNEVKHTEAEQTQVVADLTADMALPRTKGVKCAKCGHDEAVFLQAAITSNSEGMTLFFVCCNPKCQHRWRD
eukprot:CAMPEP_0197848092 /NCGR_PEP_ID=MMETSP1438-20131217/7922_1 /TAXON_ID=1461541 /ORGANISM="Pterosperma sp., Strain CCMP1384" /LENGTH=112 /DNA_ID=CAMNT_0043460223 /DNA_START=240 /DNA_END=578 /DNA_ORIENTATION=+